MESSYFEGCLDKDRKLIGVLADIRQGEENQNCVQDALESPTIYFAYIIVNVTEVLTTTYPRRIN